MKRISILILSFLFALPVFAQQMSKTIDSIRKYRNVPGMIYAVFSTDAILDSGCSGVKRIRVKDPVRWNNRFMPGSNTIIATSYVAAKMVEEGKIQWNTTIGKLFPEWDGKIMKVYARLTLKQLLSQRGGFPPYDHYEKYRDIHSMPGSSADQRLAWAQLILKRKPELIVDSLRDARYSVAGTNMAAIMLERAAKKTWEQLIELYINKPLSVKLDFGFPALKDSTQPWGHWDNYFQLTSHRDEYWAQWFTPIAPAGNLNGTMGDWITLIREEMKALEGKKANLSAASANTMMYETSFYSAGWATGQWNNNTIAYSNGKSALFSSYVEVIKEKKIAILVMCNTGTVDGRSATVAAGKALREYYVKKGD